MASLAHQLQEERERLEGRERYLDLCLILTHPQTGEAILWAGGVWDRVQQCYRDDLEPTNPCIIEVEPSQVEFITWFATWLRDFREGRPHAVSLAMLSGGRRGGKTFSAVLAVLALLIDVPTIRGQRTIGWIVSNSYKKKLEIEEQIHAFVPKSWYEERRAPEFSFTLANGALLRNLSADDPEDLRQGRAEIALYNEAQLTAPQAVQNGLYGVSDRDGLTLLAANPPNRAIGEWLIDLKESIENKELPEAVHFVFDPKLNRKIEQEARRRAGKIGRIINPSKVEADDAGVWARLGERAYPRWHKSFLVRAPEYGDITAEVMRAKTGRAYPYLGGVDFQGYPFNAGVLWRIYPGPSGYIYHAVREFLVEGAEAYFLAEVRDADFTEADIYWIGDASGQWQDGKHDFGKGGRSFAEFKKDRWSIRPPREKKTESALYSSNPPVENRLRLMAKWMDEGRIRVDPEMCPAFAESLKECPLKRDGTRVKKFGRFAHLTDAGDYPLYWCEPRPTAPSEPVDPRTWLSDEPFRRGPI